MNNHSQLELKQAAPIFEGFVLQMVKAKSKALKEKLT